MNIKKKAGVLILLFTSLFSMSSCSPFYIDSNIIDELNLEAATQYIDHANDQSQFGRCKSVKYNSKIDFNDLKAPVYNNNIIETSSLLSKTLYENKGISPVIANEQIDVKFYKRNGEITTKNQFNYIYQWVSNNDYFIQKVPYLNGDRYPTTIYKIVDDLTNEFINNEIFCGISFPYEYYNSDEIYCGFNANKDLVIKGTYIEDFSYKNDYVNASLNAYKETSFLFIQTFNYDSLADLGFDAFTYCEFNTKIYVYEDYSRTTLHEPKLIEESTTITSSKYGVMGDYDLTNFPNINPLIYQEVTLDEIY